MTRLRRQFEMGQLRSGRTPGRALLGGLLLMSESSGVLEKVLLVVAVAFGTINVVGGFLVTDRMLLPRCARVGQAEEELLVAPVVAGELALSLYLDPALLQRLAAADPLDRLHGGNVADCLTALEGVSHFLYVVWNASHDRSVTLVELEMQAEVDKFIVTHWLLRRQVPGHFPLELRRVLFERARIDPNVGSRAGLYREASGYAGRFCRYLERALQRAQGAGIAHVTATCIELLGFVPPDDLESSLLRFR